MAYNEEEKQELVTKICNQLAMGKSLIEICKLKGMPDRITFNRWVAGNEEFASLYARAREAQADYYLDRQVELAEEATVENYQLKKFQGDQLKWVAAKLNQKKYGEKQSVDVAHIVTLADLVQKSYQAATPIDITPRNDSITADVPESQLIDAKPITD